MPSFTICSRIVTIAVERPARDHIPTHLLTPGNEENRRLSRAWVKNVWIAFPPSCARLQVCRLRSCLPESYTPSQVATEDVLHPTWSTFTVKFEFVYGSRYSYLHTDSITNVMSAEMGMGLKSVCITQISDRASADDNVLNTCSSRL